MSSRRASFRLASVLLVLLLQVHVAAGMLHPCCLGGGQGHDHAEAEADAHMAERDHPPASAALASDPGAPSCGDHGEGETCRCGCLCDGAPAFAPAPGVPAPLLASGPEVEALRPSRDRIPASPDYLLPWALGPPAASQAPISI